MSAMHVCWAKGDEVKAACLVPLELEQHDKPKHISSPLSPANC